MKILLQNTLTKLYFRYGSAWTSDPDAAFDFHQPQELLGFVRKNGLKDVHMVLKSLSPRFLEVVDLAKLEATIAPEVPLPAANPTWKPATAPLP